MDTQTFLTNFGTIADAPKGIDHLRDLILELTISGRLANPGSGTDTPDTAVAKLLSNKDELLSIRSKPSIPRRPSPIEFPYRLPSSWELIRVDDSGTYTNGVAFKSSERDSSGIPIVRIQNLTNPAADFNFTNRNLKKSNLVENGDILVSWSATLDAFVWQGPRAAVNQHIFKVDPETAIFDTTFLYLCLRWVIRRLAESEALHGLAMKHINRGDFVSAVIPVPPKEEQSFLVERFNHLIALCDELETAKTKKDALRTAARESAIDAVSTASTPEELSAAWTRIQDNWTTYADTPGGIDRLRALTLDLAVRGQLVPQDAGEGDGDDFIEKLAYTDRTSVPRSSERFDIPESWTWARLADVSECRDSERIPVSRQDRQRRQGPYDYYGASGVIDKIDSFLFDKPLLLVGEDGANLVNRSTPIAFIADGQYWVNNHAHVLDSSSLATLRYLAIAINQMDLKPFLTGTAQPKLNQARLNDLLVPIPPEAEQVRIVSKVDELLALCDQLETAKTKRDALQERFASSVIHEAAHTA